jgi:hypothetical protein
LDLRPLELGELVDRSAGFWRAHWKSLFRLYLGFQLVQYLALRAFELASRAWFPVLRGGRLTNEAMRGDPEALLGQFLVAGPAMLALTVLLAALTHALSVAGSAYVIPNLLGRGATVGSAVKRMADRLGATLGLVGLSFAWFIGWGLLAVLPGAGLLGLTIAVESQALKALFLALALLWMMFAGLALVLIYVVRFATAGQVLAMEEAGAFAAYRRAGALSSGTIKEGALGLVKLRLTLIITVVSVILLVVALMGGLPALIIQGYYGKVFDPVNADPDAVPQLLLVPAQLLQLVVGSLVAPLYAVTMGWFYVDMRMRREGLDLELKLGPK